jgi:hypothetical protein
MVCLTVASPTILQTCYFHFLFARKEDVPLQRLTNVALVRFQNNFLEKSEQESIFIQAKETKKKQTCNYNNDRKVLRQFERTRNNTSGKTKPLRIVFLFAHNKV